MLRVILAFIVALAPALPAAAQSTAINGTIEGTVTDDQGAVLPGVTVTAGGAQGAKTSVTDAEGRYTIPFLTPGTYTLRAEIQGFKPVERTGIQVRLGQALEIPLTMELGGVQETIQVTGTATVIDATSTTIGSMSEPGTTSGVINRTICESQSLKA